MKIHDISMEIYPDMLVYPGNPAPRIDQYKSIQDEGIGDIPKLLRRDGVGASEFVLLH